MLVQTILAQKLVSAEIYSIEFLITKLHEANFKLHEANNMFDFSVLFNNHYELNFLFIRIVKP